MRILSLDTAMAACSAAVVDTGSDAILASAFVPMERGHAEAIAPMVKEVMTKAGLAYSSIDRIAVTTGPGTFTGVRIGLAMARGLGLALNIPVIGIDTLTAIAVNDGSGSDLLVVADARNGEVYAARFDGKRNLLEKPCVARTSEVLDERAPSPLLLGAAAQAVLTASGRKGIHVSSSCNLPVAAHFAYLAAAAPIPDAMPSPLYLRAPDAKPQSVPLRRAVNLTFRSADASAAPLLASMHAEAFDIAWSPTEFKSLLAMPNAEAVIALEQDEPAGFVLTRRAADEAEIITVCTRPFAQRRGVAKALLDHQFTELSHHGVAHVFIEVATSKTAARALYDRLGFTEAGKRTNYYTRADGKTEDAIIMRRDLKP